MQDEQWAESVNPFPQTTLEAQELAKKVEPIVGSSFFRVPITGPRVDPTHFNLLKIGLHGYITECLDNEIWIEFYTEEDKTNLVRLGEALERLAEGKLRLQNTEEIDTITGKGLTSFWQVEHQHIAYMQPLLKHGADSADEAERLMWRDVAELQGIRKVRYLLEEIADQLSEEVRRQHGLGGNGRT